MHTSRFSPTYAFAFAVLVAACGGSVASQNDPPTGSPGAGNGGGSGSGSGAGGGASSGGARCDGLPECDPGDYKVKSASECPADDVECYPRETCGATVWCWKPRVQCAAYPTCPNGTAEVKSCPSNTKCISETVCGATILCAPMCLEPPPGCDMGDSIVSGPSACVADGRCYSRTACSQTIWCTGPAK